MRKSRFSEEQIINVLKEQQAVEGPIADPVLAAQIGNHGRDAPFPRTRARKTVQSDHS